MSRKSLWKSEYVIDVYELAKSGMSEAKIAKALGISYPTFLNWEVKKPEFKSALQMGRRIYKGVGKEAANFREYIYDRLPKNLRLLWNKIDQLDKKKSGYEKIEAILANRGVDVRQHLFVYAWVAGNFSISQALRKVCLSRGTFDKWRNEDPEFAALIEEINWHKKNFLEDHLFKLIRGGREAATIFANKTYNKDRGYNEKIDVGMSGELHQTVSSIDVTKLPIKIRKGLLKSLRQQEKNLAS